MKLLLIDYSVSQDCVCKYEIVMLMNAIKFEELDIKLSPIPRFESELHLCMTLPILGDIS